MMVERLLSCLLAALALFCVAQIGVAAKARSGSQEDAGQGNARNAQGGYYDLKDYEYFSEAAPAPTPKPASPPAPDASSRTAVRASAPSIAASSQARPVEAPRGEGVDKPLEAGVEAGPHPAPAAAAGIIGPYPKGDTAKAKADAKALATPARAGAAALPTSTDLGATIPGYTAAAQPQEAYADDPAGLTSAGTSSALSSDAWKMVTDPGRTVVHLGPGEMARAKSVEGDPNSFLRGESLDGATGSCKPLPATSTQDYYEATCNEGLRVDQSPKTCRTPLVVETKPGATKYVYTCQNWTGRLPFSYDNTAYRCQPAFAAPVASGICRERSRQSVRYPVCHQGTMAKCYEPDEADGEEITYECDSAAVSRPHVTETVGGVVNEHRDETQCKAAIGTASCTQTSEVCTDATPGTRMVDGVPVTRACWNWERTYQCTGTSEASDCGSLKANASCSFLRDECLDDTESEPCKVTNKVYRCPVPSAPAAGVNQYICGDDVYCINGDCEPVEREASTEFKDAVVGLNVLKQANTEFDEKDLTLFSGEHTGCHKPVFGLVNCCAGKSSGLLTAAAGGAALISGPAAIAALATPFLTTFLCSAEEKTLDVKDRMGLCHNLGSYCSQKALFICTTKRTAYCCFESKLTRILQEQGRLQIGKAWDKPKKETCKGFSIDEFAALDLSKMDFAEVYAEFVDAAKLPDEVATTKDIQDRIADYYARHGKP